MRKLYQHQGRSEAAIEEYTKLLATEAKNSAIYRELAAIYRQQSQWNAAIEVYEKAVARGITEANIFSSLGELYLQIGNTEQALNNYTQAVQTGERRIAIYQQLEQLYLAQKNTTDAEFLWNTYALVNKDKPDALFQLVQHYHKHGEWLKAVNLSKEILASTPTNVTYRKFLANLYEQQELLFETIEQWEKLVTMDSKNIEYNLQLASLYERSEQWDKARLQYRKILRLQPNHHKAQEKLLTLGGETK